VGQESVALRETGEGTLCRFYYSLSASDDTTDPVPYPSSFIQSFQQLHDSFFLTAAAAHSTVFHHCEQRGQEFIN